MASRNLEQLMRSADALTADEMLEAANQLIKRARTKSPTTWHDVNLLAGTLELDEDPIAIQERMRREWE